MNSCASPWTEVTPLPGSNLVRRVTKNLARQLIANIAFPQHLPEFVPQRMQHQLRIITDPCRCAGRDEGNSYGCMWRPMRGSHSTVSGQAAKKPLALWLLIGAVMGFLAMYGRGAGSRRTTRCG